MDARKYEVIIKAAECGNLTRAGEDFGYTQSGVSHMIKAVETEFGFRIFLRGRGGVTLTEEGARVLPYLREIVKWNERLTQTVGSLNGLIAGTLRIGSFSSIAAHWLPQIIKRFQSDYPNIKIEITEGGTDALEAALEEGAADLALMTCQPGRGFEHYALYSDPFLAILPPEHPLASRSEFPLEAFNGEDFVIVTHSYDYATSRILEEHSLTPNIKFTSRDERTIFSMVENGLGVSILPELVMRGWSGRAVTLPLKPGVTRELAICLPSFAEASPACKRFVTYVKKMVARDGSVRELPDGEKPRRLTEGKSPLFSSRPLVASSELPRHLKRVPASSSPSVAAAAGNAALHAGQTIEHERFGMGTVLRVEGTGENVKATIRFENVGEKQLLLRFARFKVVE